MCTRFVLTLLAAAVLALPIQAQSMDQGATVPSSLPAPDQPIPTMMTPDLVPPQVPDSYLIGPDDLLSIFVYEMPDMTVQVRVDGNGAIHLPLLRTPLRAAGLRSTEIARVVARALQRNGIANDPEVLVTVRQVMSKPVIVSGAVKQPQVVEAARPMTLIEALARAGGPAPNAGTTVVVNKKGMPDISISLRDLMNGTGRDPLLRGGETVRVQTERLVYVVGALQKPGAFPLRAGDGITVLKALALAGGFNTTVPSDKKHALIIRSQPVGAPKQLPVNLQEILSHKAPDLPLQAGDILYVPENGRRKALNAALADMGQALAIAVGYSSTRF